MHLSEAFAPTSIDDLRTQFYGRQCVARARQVGAPNPFKSLLTLEELDTRLNDAVASQTNLSIIGKDGTKLPRDEIYCPQPVRSWSNEFVRKSRVHELLQEGCSFVMHNMTHITPRVAELVASVEEIFEHHQADVHLYVSPKKGSTGYLAHRDQPQHKIYLQLYGTTEWTIFRGTHKKAALTADEAQRHLQVDFQVSMTPGSILYMPPAVFHRAESPHGPRVSLSIPFNRIPGTYQVDRHHIPLVEMFNKGNI